MFSGSIVISLVALQSPTFCGYIHESYGYEYNNFLVDNIRRYIHALEIS